MGRRQVLRGCGGHLCQEVGIADKVAHKKIIIPGYAASISGDMEEELPGWEIIIGPRDASLIPKFLKDRWAK
jgi:acetyl-CoA decarbonylase/synthase, CODH/ACS complex subunit gamma